MGGRAGSNEKSMTGRQDAGRGFGDALSLCCDDSTSNDTGVSLESKLLL